MPIVLPLTLLFSICLRILLMIDRLIVREPAESFFSWFGIYILTPKDENAGKILKVFLRENGYDKP
jgi:hypothetical protein